jgi:hypothetical protein
MRILIFTFLMIFTASVNAKSINVDNLLRTANIDALIGTNTPLNLHAQMKDPAGKTQDVNDFDDFIALGVINSTQHTVIAEFDATQKIIQKVEYDQPWIGVSPFSQSEIPAMTLQEGFAAVKACIGHTPDEITRVAIYKTQLSKEIVYDYVFLDPSLSANRCQEYLYLPAKNECQVGTIASCHLDPSKPIGKMVGEVK